ncbi:MAG: hypothetical protein QOH93_2346 [Chloroflexia bacterium]|jgi:hypothetical protein|nr:hypothetical protein [Chloroflexia bacterium]
MNEHSRVPDPDQFIREAAWTDALLERYSPRLWAQRYVPTERGQSLTFEGKPWLRSVYDDLHPRKVFQKAAQLGMTTWGIAQALYLTGVHGQSVIFTEPTAEDTQILVSSRLDKMIAASPRLRHLTGRSGNHGRPHPTDNTEVKHVGLGTLYLRGTQTEREALSVFAHALFHDEVDRSRPETLEMYRYRLASLPPDQHQINLLSTPTIAGYGICEAYEQSDAREWFVRCQSCSCQQPLDYWEHTKGELPYLACTRCGAVLNPIYGEWVAKYPERSSDVHGYLMSSLLLALPDRPDVLESLHKTRSTARHERHFYNMHLALPSSDGADRITRQQMLGALFTQEYAMQERAELGTGPCYMGVDQGTTLTVTIARADPRRDGGRLRVVYLARLTDRTGGHAAWEKVEQLMKDFEIRMCIVDGGPSKIHATDMAKKFPARVLLCFYGEDQRAEVVEPAEVRQRAEQNSWSQAPLDSTSKVHISVDRTDSLDRTAEDLRGGKFALPSPSTHPEVEALMRHCEANVRLLEPKADGTPVYRWHGTGANDYFHALNYLRLAAERAEHQTQSSPFYGPVILRSVKTPRSKSGFGPF